MSSPFSKMDFLLILNFMENELKLKDETISLLKKKLQRGQLIETKYGQMNNVIKPKDKSFKNKDSKNTLSQNSSGSHFLSKLDNLLTSHNKLTCELKQKLVLQSDALEQTSGNLTHIQTLSRHYEGACLEVDHYTDDVMSLVHQLHMLKCDNNRVSSNVVFHRGLQDDALVQSLLKKRRSQVDQLTSLCAQIGEKEGRLEKVKSMLKLYERRLVEFEMKKNFMEIEEKKKQKNIEVLIENIKKEIELVERRSGERAKEIQSTKIILQTSQQNKSPQRQLKQIQHSQQKNPLQQNLCPYHLQQQINSTQRQNSPFKPQQVSLQQNIYNTTPYISSTVKQLLDPARKGRELTVLSQKEVKISKTNQLHSTFNDSLAVQAHMSRQTSTPRNENIVSSGTFFSSLKSCLNSFDQFNPHSIASASLLPTTSATFTSTSVFKHKPPLPARTSKLVTRISTLSPSPSSLPHQYPSSSSSSPPTKSTLTSKVLTPL